MPYKNKDIQLEYLKTWHKKKKAKNPDKHREEGRLQSQKNRINNPLLRRLASIRSRAKHKCWEFNLDISDLLLDQICPVFGTLLTWDPKEKDLKKQASVDRVDSDRGYTKDNVAIISRRANLLKNNMHTKELKRLVAYVEAHERQKELEAKISSTPRVEEVFPTSADGESETVLGGDITTDGVET